MTTRSMTCQFGAFRALLLIGCGLILGLALRAPFDAHAQESTGAAGDPELAKIYAEDQADRQPADGKTIDWAAVTSRDRAREVRVKEMIQADTLKTGADFYHAAMVLQHAPRPEDYLLAHELSVVAIGKGEERAKWLAAASEDRFLSNIGRPQRFGTQYRANGPNQPMRLIEVDPAMTDVVRKHFNAPTLDAARAREAAMNTR